jgi:hypothetical protein
MSSEKSCPRGVFFLSKANEDKLLLFEQEVIHNIGMTQANP